MSRYSRSAASTRYLADQDARARREREARGREFAAELVAFARAQLALPASAAELGLAWIGANPGRAAYPAALALAWAELAASTPPTVEPIPADCLPLPEVMEQALAGPKVGADGRIVGGAYNGMTPAEVLAARDAFNRACGE